jgi:SWI/SNF-related matrix-associated actin-dependent regulator of chromatin subfamily A3
MLRHTFPHKVTFHRHLDTDRSKQVNLLLERDVVFTTFATALEDFKSGQSPLSQIHWYRIVLDEGGNISQY